MVAAEMGGPVGVPVIPVDPHGLDPGRLAHAQLEALALVGWNIEKIVVAPRSYFQSPWCNERGTEWFA